MQAKIQGPGAKFWLQWAITMLIATGVGCLALFAWYQFESRFFQVSLGDEFEQQRQQSSETPYTEDSLGSATSSAHPGRPGPLSGVVGRLEIPRIGVEVIVLKGTDATTLRRGAGWLPTTSRPGVGNAAIAAHRDTHFRPLRNIKEGDTIRLTTLDASYDFQVEWAAVVDPDDTEVLAPTGKPALTLITCYPFNVIGNAPQRFVVRAIGSEPLTGAASDLFDDGAEQCWLDADGGPTLRVSD